MATVQLPPLLTAACTLLLSFTAHATPPSRYIATPISQSHTIIYSAADDPGFTLEWRTIDSGGGRLSEGSLVLEGTLGQADASGSASAMAGDGFELIGGFWPGAEGGMVVVCYANCDHSSIAPVLNVADFGCFLNRFAAQDPYANCDLSTAPPTLNIADFSCFLQKFAAGCP